jgi:hypothetical protein
LKKAGRDNRFAYLLVKKAVMPYSAKTRYKNNFHTRFPKKQVGVPAIIMQKD